MFWVNIKTVKAFRNIFSAGPHSENLRVFGKVSGKGVRKSFGRCWSGLQAHRSSTILKFIDGPPIKNSGKNQETNHINFSANGGPYLYTMVTAKWTSHYTIIN